MSNLFYRKPIIGADENSWAPLNDAHLNVGLGACSVKLYDDGGTLKVSKGIIGISDGTVTGIAYIDTVTTISLAGISNGNWAKIEMSVSGTSVTFTATDIAGATDPEVLPAGFTGSFDDEKRGYYITATKRCIGLAWKNSSGTLEGIANVLNNVEGYEGYSISDDANDNWYYFDLNKVSDSKRVDTLRAMYVNVAGTKSIKKLLTKIIEIGSWNMNTTSAFQVAHGLSDHTKIRTVTGMITNDAGTTLYPIGIGPSSTTANGDQQVWFRFATSTNIELLRLTSGDFDGGGAPASGNRGWLVVEYEE